jgi:hypothetical protein
VERHELWRDADEATLDNAFEGIYAECCWLLAAGWCSLVVVVLVCSIVLLLHKKNK